MHTVLTQGISTILKTICQLFMSSKGSYPADRIINSLPHYMKGMMNKKIYFLLAFKRYINTHSFSLFDEVLRFKSDT